MKMNKAKCKRECQGGEFLFYKKCRGLATLVRRYGRYPSGYLEKGHLSRGTSKDIGLVPRAHLKYSRKIKKPARLGRCELRTEEKETRSEKNERARPQRTS